jgi:RNA recognition motif-containing protein
MSLFVGNVSRNASYKDIENEFKRFGECRVDLRGSYGFIEYTKESNAEEAKEELQGKNFGGLKINIEWSKKSGKFDASAVLSRTDDRGGRRRRDNSNDRSRDRRRKRSNSRSGSRSPRRDRRRNNFRGRRNSRSRSGSLQKRTRKSPTYSPIKRASEESKKSETKAKEEVANGENKEDKQDKTEKKKRDKKDKEK